MLNLHSAKIRKVLRAAVRPDTYFAQIEALMVGRGWASSQPQLFILGLPRSGTTLVYQYIVHRLRVAYFTNGVGRFPTAPCLISKLQHTIYGQYISDFESKYGKVSGPVAPREAGGFWCRYFDIDNYSYYEDLDLKKVAHLRNTIACIQTLFGGLSFVNKNVKHLLRVDALRKTFPASRFLVVERPLTDVAISLLRARYKNMGHPEKWWSVKPIGYENLMTLAPYQQIAWQVVLLREKMENDFAMLEPNRVMRVDYKLFCETPDELIRKISSSMEMMTSDNQQEQYFECKKHVPQTAEEVMLINELQHILDSRKILLSHRE